MTSLSHTEAGQGDLTTLAGQQRHYAGVSERLNCSSALAAQQPIRRRVHVRPQTHRPDYQMPVPKLPMVVIDDAVKAHVQDILVIAQEERGDTPDPLLWQDIINEVCAKHQVTKLELMSLRRAVPIVLARHEAMWRMSNETSMSLPAIGRRMGGRDHTTVLYAIRAHEARRNGECYHKPRRRVDAQ